MNRRSTHSRARVLALPTALPNTFAYLQDVSPTRALAFLVALLAISYVGLMAFTMSYAVIQTQYAEQARDAEAQVGALETQYFDALARVDAENPVALGYVQPPTPQFAVIPGAPAVAMALPQ